jgi:3-hydroxyacyl-[acyl-carrier-protein] dehydratase
MTHPESIQRLLLNNEKFYRPNLLTGAELLRHLPQQEPFRFVDEVLEVSERHIVCRYTYHPEREFYRGHFPGQPVTPGVILLETMAQSVVLQGINMFLKDGASSTEYRTMFTDAQVEWHSPVRPGETVTINAELLTWRRMRIRSKVQLTIGNEARLGATGVIAGMGVKL